jgi:hypothetical protein
VSVEESPARSEAGANAAVAPGRSPFAASTTWGASPGVTALVSTVVETDPPSVRFSVYAGVLASRLLPRSSDTRLEGLDRGPIRIQSGRRKRVRGMGWSRPSSHLGRSPRCLPGANGDPHTPPDEATHHALTDTPVLRQVRVATGRRPSTKSQYAMVAPVRSSLRSRHGDVEASAGLFGADLLRCQRVCQHLQSERDEPSPIPRPRIGLLKPFVHAGRIRSRSSAGSTSWGSLARAQYSLVADPTAAGRPSVIRARRG